MCKHGFPINIFGVLVITIANFTIIPAVFGYDPSEVPAWAIPAP
jgi:hypothetical protein